jgi:hypothetical protein
MARRLALQGASEDDTTLLRDLLIQAAPSLHSAWKFHSGADADLLVIDIDTVYGHMDWLRAHSTGKPVAVLTEHAQFGDSDLILHKPPTLSDMVDVLNRVDAYAPQRPQPESAAVEPASIAAPKPAPAAEPAAVAVAASAPEPVHAPEPVPVPEPPRGRRLSDWLADGALTAPVCLRDAGAPELALDPAAKVFHADTSLRPLAAYCTRTIAREDWLPLDATDLTRLQAAGKAQPYARLLWLCHALGSNGHLAPGLDINAKYKLARWPQIEREFPKHFRIATVMLKQPATLTEVAEQSGATLADVIDFTNAYNATGYIEIEGVAPAEAPTRDTGRSAILARLRKPFGGG